MLPILLALLLCCGVVIFLLLRDRKRLQAAAAQSARPKPAAPASADDFVHLSARPAVEQAGALEAADGFSHHIAHELTGPLGSIDLLAFLAEQHLGRQDPDSARREVSRIRDQVRDAHDTVKALLRLADPAQQAVRCEDVDLTELARLAARDAALTISAQSGGKTLPAIDIAELGRVQSDPGLLRIVLINLISNALKFNLGRDQVIVKIVRGDRSSDDRPCLVICDNGVGFDAQMTDRAGNSFWRSPATSHVEGYGLGLQIVKRAVARLGGEVVVESRPEEGTSVRIMLDGHSQQSPRKNHRVPSQVADTDATRE
jgi:signal transduction histidine kinase